jgi:hypothetical protein
VFHLPEEPAGGDVVPTLRHLHAVRVEAQEHVRVQRLLEQTPDPKPGLALVRVLLLVSRGPNPREMSEEDK